MVHCEWCLLFRTRGLENRHCVIQQLKSIRTRRAESMLEILQTVLGDTDTSKMPTVWATKDVDIPDRRVERAKEEQMWMTRKLTWCSDDPPAIVRELD